MNSLRSINILLNKEPTMETLEKKHLPKAAYPCGEDIGATLRDYNATRAMQAMLDPDTASTSFKDIADDAYKMADEMMRARKDSRRQPE
jgi:hypothetical protein